LALSAARHIYSRYQECTIVLIPAGNILTEESCCGVLKCYFPGGIAISAIIIIIIIATIIIAPHSISYLENIPEITLFLRSTAVKSFKHKFKHNFLKTCHFLQLYNSASDC
jgi:hypothetical protein